MDISEFIQNVEEQFMETEPGSIHETTEFRNLEEWSSLIALMIIAMVDEKYDVILSGDDIRNSNTIQEIYTIVHSKVNQ
jgi:acyl carrier protein